MGYPYGKTYLEQIQESNDAEAVRNAYYILKKKYVADHLGEDEISLSLKTEFALLGEAFKLASLVGDIPDVYHFMQDILEVLLERKTNG